MIERLKICWYALTKKEYLFMAIDKREIGNSGAVCFDNCHDTSEYHVFYDAVKTYCDTQIEKL